jgi:tocopherol O-methyltransferase
MNNRNVIEYYDYTIPFYKVFWHKGTNAIHYGFWDSDTATHTDALINTNKVLADTAQLHESDIVLDAGCGVGGSALYLARERGCTVTGITLSEKQRAKAVTYARRAGLDSKTKFLVRDFLNTGFPDNTFTVVWAIESVCYAEDKAEFLKEAFRILKPGGRLIVADGFLGRLPEGKENSIYQDFLKGFALSNLATLDSFAADMNHVGFSHIVHIDKTEAIGNTAEYMYRLSTRWFWAQKTLRSLRLIPQLMLDNLRTGIVQREFFAGVGKYAVFCGVKAG